MNCKLCKQELEAYREGKLPDGIRDHVKTHLENCKDCAALYQMEIIASKVMDDEKQAQPNPFLSTRIMAKVEAMEQQSVYQERFTANQKVLKPVLFSMAVAASILIGIWTGNIYKPDHSKGKIPVEISYMNDESLESVDLLANN